MLRVGENKIVGCRAINNRLENISREIQRTLITSVDNLNQGVATVSSMNYFSSRSSHNNKSKSFKLSDSTE